MELRDYLRALRHSWPIIVATTLVGVAIALAYLAIAPRDYTASAVMVLTVSSPETISDLQEGTQYAASSAATAAVIIDSPAVLAAVGRQLDLDVDRLQDMVTTTTTAGSTVIGITVVDRDPSLAERVANLAADEASEVVPLLQTGVSGSRAPISLDLIRPATEPTSPSSPNIQGVLAIGLIAGLSVGLALTIIRHSLYRRVRDSADLGSVVSSTTLARIPRDRRALLPNRVVVRDDPDEPAAEGYRVLRTNLARLEDAERRSILVAPVTADDGGGDDVALNLGWALAQTRRRTVVVDIDLRDSRIGDMLELPHERGVSDVLAGESSLGDLVRRTADPYLFAVLSGTPRPGPSDVLSSPEVAEIIAELESKFDYVILRAPALLSHTDAANVARSAAWTIVTVGVGAAAADVAVAFDRLENVNVEPLGVVLVEGRRRRGRVRPSPEPAANSLVDTD